MTLQSALEKVLAEYPVARTEELENHDLAAFIRHDLFSELAALVGAGYAITGSPGQGNWAETPWAAVFDPGITTSARKGYYVVYLFRGDGDAVFLSLNQATTEVRDEFPRQYRNVLAGRAEYACELLGPFGIDGLVLGSLYLGGTGSLTRGYEVGNIAAIRYEPGAVPPDPELMSDLHRMLGLYGTYKAARQGAVTGGTDDLPPDVAPGEEARKYRWHRRAERNRRLADAAKTIHGYTCVVCGLNFENEYGDVGKGYIEAHHLVPFAQLAQEPEPVVLGVG
jgi:5-methylcytosine-specific restriction protein A